MVLVLLVLLSSLCLFLLFPSLILPLILIVLPPSSFLFAGVGPFPEPVINDVILRREELVVEYTLPEPPPGSSAGSPFVAKMVQQFSLDPEFRRQKQRSRPLPSARKGEAGFSRPPQNDDFQDERVIRHEVESKPVMPRLVSQWP